MSHRRGYMQANNVPVQSTMTAPRAYYLPDDAELSEADLERGFTWNQEHGGSPQGGHNEMHENMGPGNTQTDITEIYRRKSPENYNVPAEVMMPEEHPRYYYRPAALSRLPQRRLPIPFNPSGPSGPAGLGPYYPPPLEEPRASYAEMLYRSQPQIQRIHESRPMTSNPVPRPPPRLMLDTNRPMTNLVRSIRSPSPAKPPVSVRTPRYYRRQNIYKRPSILCLQLPSTPDPSARPIKSRLPSTMPGLLPLHMRAHTPSPYPHQHQPISCGVAVPVPPPPRGQREMEDRERERERVRGRISARSAPPIMGGKEEEMERVRMVLESRNMQEFGDDNLSLINDQETETKCSELELLLNQYEQIFNSGSEAVNNSKQSSRRSSTRTKVRRRASVGRFIGLLKPKIPPSLKKNSSSKSSLKHSQSTRLEIEQMTAEVLDNLLQDLSAGGIVSNTKEDNRTPRTNRSVTNAKEREGERESREPANERPREESGEKSGDSSGVKLEAGDDNRNRSKSDMKSKKSESFFDSESKKVESDNIPTNTTFIQDQDKFNFESSTTVDKGKTSDRNSRGSSPISFDFNSRAQTPEGTPATSAPGSREKDSIKRSLWTSNNRLKPEPDGTTALELHRSKSYIVNLIDRALSRELGTIPEERASKQYLNLDQKAAMDLMQNKQIDTDMCLEISQAIAESFGKEPGGCPVCTSQPGCSNQTPSCCSKGADRGDPGKDGELLFSSGSDEPLYIKQLKKLRWGHLKHIQREMRRLEDLERFLDSCGSEK